MRATRIPHDYKVIKGVLVYDMLELHKQYGDVVRIAPNELAFANPEAWREIMGHRGKSNDRGEFEKELQPLCVEQGIGVINFYALASGFLTGKYRTPEDAAKSKRGQNTVAKYLNERGRKILAALDQAAARTGGTPAQVAVAWVMAQPGITSPILGPRTTAQLEHSVRSLEVKLSDEIMAKLDEIWPAPGVAPEAYAW